MSVGESYLVVAVVVWEVQAKVGLLNQLLCNSSEEVHSGLLDKPDFKWLEEFLLILTGIIPKHFASVISK